MGFIFAADMMYWCCRAGGRDAEIQSFAVPAGNRYIFERTIIQVQKLDGYSRGGLNIEVPERFLRVVAGGLGDDDRLFIYAYEKVKDSSYLVRMTRCKLLRR